MVKRTRSFVGFGLVAVISVAEFKLVSEEHKGTQQNVSAISGVTLPDDVTSPQYKLAKYYLSLVTPPYNSLPQ